MHKHVFTSQVGSIKQIHKKALTFMIKYKVTEHLMSEHVFPNSSILELRAGIK